MLLTVTAMVASASLCRLDAFGTRPSGDAIRVRSPWLAQQRAGEANRGDRVDRAVPLRAASTPSDFGQPSPQGHKQLRSEVPSQRPPSPVSEMQRDDREGPRLFARSARWRAGFGAVGPPVCGVPRAEDGRRKLRR